jgi:hypothetical protein
MRCLETVHVPTKGYTSTVLLRGACARTRPAGPPPSNALSNSVSLHLLTQNKKVSNMPKIIQRIPNISFLKNIRFGEY